MLAEIGAGEVPQIEVFNKVDLLDDETVRIERDAHGAPVRVWVSAMTGDGVDALRAVLADICNPDMVTGVLRVPATAGRLRSRLFELGVVDDERYESNGDALLSVTASESDLARLIERAGLTVEDVLVQRRAARMSVRETSGTHIH